MPQESWIEWLREVKQWAGRSERKTQSKRSAGGVRMTKNLSLTPAYAVGVIRLKLKLKRAEADFQGQKKKLSTGRRTRG
jgi:hypothetical protein